MLTGLLAYWPGMLKALAVNWAGHCKAVCWFSWYLVSCTEAATKGPTSHVITWNSMKPDCFNVIAGPPTIIQGETTQTVNVDEGQNTTLRCAATGYPTPNISWVRVNGNPLPPPYNRYAVKVFVLFFSSIKLVSEARPKCFSLLWNCCALIRDVANVWCDL